MGRNNYFQFKQFRIIQQRAAMKVGTDSILLGAWARVSSVKKLLDIGTGTGVIALMMAQRSEAQITGIEIEKNAAQEARENAKNSPWGKRITILNKSFQEFLKNEPGRFQLVVSNPPFFSNSQKSKCNYLAMAKHNHLLPPDELARGSARLLAPGGRLAIILPLISAREFIKIAAKEGLFLLRLTEVYPNSTKNSHRYLMEFGQNKNAVEKDFLHIHTADGTSFTEEYKVLTRDFFLDF